MRRLVALATLLLGSLGAADAPAITISYPNERPGDPPRLLQLPIVFVGTIDSVAGPDAWIRVAEVLHGTGIARRQPIHWSLGDVCEEVGTRIVAMSHGPHAGELWCALLRVESDGRLAGVRLTPPNSLIKSSIAEYPMALFLPRREAPQLAELREVDAQYSGKRTPVPFAAATAFDLVAVESLGGQAPDRVELRLRRIRRLLGASAASPTVAPVSVHADGGGSVIPAVGDTLLLPSTNGEPRLGFTTRPGDFLVDRGYVSRFDVALEDVGDRMRRIGEGYVMVAGGLGQAE